MRLATLAEPWEGCAAAGQGVTDASTSAVGALERYKRRGAGWAPRSQEPPLPLPLRSF